jgi:hypothetical protein
MSDTSNRKLALRIAERLFTNGYREVAERLIIELPGKRDGGGWGFYPAVDQIEDILNGQK